MIGENRQLVADEPLEFEKYPVEVGDFRRNTDHLEESQISIRKTKGCQHVIGWTFKH